MKKRGFYLCYYCNKRADRFHRRERPSVRSRRKSCLQFFVFFRSDRMGMEMSQDVRFMTDKNVAGGSTLKDNIFGVGFESNVSFYILTPLPIHAKPHSR